MKHKCYDSGVINMPHAHSKYTHAVQLRTRSKLWMGTWTMRYPNSHMELIRIAGWKLLSLSLSMMHSKQLFLKSMVRLMNQKYDAWPPPFPVPPVWLASFVNYTGRQLQCCLYWNPYWCAPLPFAMMLSLLLVGLCSVECFNVSYVSCALDVTDVDWCQILAQQHLMESHLMLSVVIYKKCTIIHWNIIIQIFLKWSSLQQHSTMPFVCFCLCFLTERQTLTISYIVLYSLWGFLLTAAPAALKNRSICNDMVPEALWTFLP